MCAAVQRAVIVRETLLSSGREVFIDSLGNEARRRAALRHAIVFGVNREARIDD